MKAARALLVVIATLRMVPSSTGSTCLVPPWNVTIHVVKTNITLKWDWENPCGLSVTFSAQYKEIQEDEKNLEYWTVIPECQNVISTECDLSLLELDYFGYYNVSVRVEVGKESSPWASLNFSPYFTAQIGPPGVLLESVDGNVNIKIIPPEENQSEYATLTYKLAIWKNSPKSEEKYLDVFSGQNLSGLQPDTTYCLKVKASLEDRKALWSPEYCIKTPKALDGLAPPTNLRVHALNMKCILYWDNLYNGSVSFTVQFIYGYKRQYSSDYSKEWITVPGCENITRAHCDFSSTISFHGIFYLHVRTMNSHSKSPWSDELKFEPLIENEIGPPSVKVNATENSLRILIVPPGELENHSMSKYYPFTYNISYWNNSSYAKVTVEEKSTSFIIPNLSPSTVYCLTVLAWSSSKSSKLSNVTCVETTSGQSDQDSLVIAIVFFFAAAVLVTVALGASWYIWKKIKYAFFPSCKLPSTIEKTGGRDPYSSYLISTEESTDKCVLVIENSIPHEINQINYSSFHLPAPQNVTVVSYNFQNTLKWSPVMGINSSAVSYRVEYRTKSYSVWAEVNSKNITKPEYYFTDDFNEFLEVIFRVRTEQGGLKSDWVETFPFRARSQTVLGPPREIDATVEANSICVSYKAPFDNNSRFFAFQYLIFYWKKSTDEDLPSSDKVEVVNTSNTKYKLAHLMEMTEYCFYIQAELPEKGLHGQSSDTYCKKTSLTETTRILSITLPFIFAVVVLIIIFFCLIAIQKHQNVIKSLWRPPLTIPMHYEEDLQNPQMTMVEEFKNCAGEDQWDSVSVISNVDQHPTVTNSTDGSNQEVHLLESDELR